MNTKITERNKRRFRRVSKARIFDGHPLKFRFNAVFVMVLTFVVITSVISLFFSLLHGMDFFLVLWTLFPGALLGFVLLVLERSLGQLKNYMLPQMGKFLTAFLLFFIHTIGYLALSSIVVNYPIGYFMEKTIGLTGMAGEYSLFSVNFFIVLALLSWLRNVRSSPNPCF
ncbi:hypothetical protein ACFLZQ_06980 [Thermodesulfobacteriota bacterium]